MVKWLSYVVSTYLYGTFDCMFLECHVRVSEWIRSWHDRSIKSNTPYRQVLITQLNHLASLAKWLIARLQTKWLWVRVPWQSLKRKISRLFQARSSLTFSNYRLWIHSETRMWNDKNIKSLTTLFRKKKSKTVI